jgi:hypothetical protein
MLYIKCPSVTVICSAFKDGITFVRKLKMTSSVEGPGLILLPPFVTKVLLDLPLLACNKVFIVVMEAITAFDKASKTPAPTPPTIDPTQVISPNELPMDPIEEPDDPDIVIVATVTEEDVALSWNPPPKQSPRGLARSCLCSAPATETSSSSCTLPSSSSCSRQT